MQLLLIYCLDTIVNAPWDNRIVPSHSVRALLKTYSYYTSMKDTSSNVAPNNQQYILSKRSGVSGCPRPVISLSNQYIQPS